MESEEEWSGLGVPSISIHSSNSSSDTRSSMTWNTMGGDAEEWDLPLPAFFLSEEAEEEGEGEREEEEREVSGLVGVGA